MSLVLGLIKRPTSKSGRYYRWVKIGWRPVPFRGGGVMPLQDRFRLRVRIHPRVGSQPDVWADTGESTTSLAVHKPHMEVNLHVLYDPGAMPQCLYEVACALHQTARHEIEHLLDEGLLALPGPLPLRSRRLETQETWQKSIRMSHWMRARARLFARGSVSRKKWQAMDVRLYRESIMTKCSVVDYIVSPRELHAFVKGFHAEARFRRVTWDVPMHEYMDAMHRTGRLTQEEMDLAKSMLTRWAAHVLPNAPISESTLARYL